MTAPFQVLFTKSKPHVFLGREASFEILLAPAADQPLHHPVLQLPRSELCVQLSGFVKRDAGDRVWTQVESRMVPTRVAFDFVGRARIDIPAGVLSWANPMAATCVCLQLQISHVTGQSIGTPLLSPCFTVAPILSDADPISKFPGCTKAMLLELAKSHIYTLGDLRALAVDEARRAEVRSLLQSIVSTP
eukprot:c16454_g1_i1.p1 GENE.c16454_g1_i1~~c16454_g1_i1.p1  ORF type:complete len:213 (+),score=29.20 c16454_g1_i1:70-639(+)